MARPSALSVYLVLIRKLGILVEQYWDYADEKTGNSAMLASERGRAS